MGRHLARHDERQPANRARLYGERKEARGAMRMIQLGHASELGSAERFCWCCEKPLRGAFRWLELDQRTNTYHDRGDVPGMNSQGWFPFGLRCAKKLVAKHAKLVAKHEEP